MAIFLLRHTRTAIAETVCYGALDVPLATTYAQDWANLSIPLVDRIYSSPLSRCLELADHIAQIQGRNILVEPRLMEMSFGDWQGNNWDDIPRDNIDAWAEDFLHYRGHGGESVSQLRQRVSTFLDELPANENHLLVSHAGVIRSALTLTRDSDDRQIKVDYGELIQLN